jgi:hypothetical protein
MRVIQQDDRVEVCYVKVFQDGPTFSSHGKSPAELIVGIDHPRLPGLGLSLAGLTVGESRGEDASPRSHHRLDRRWADLWLARQQGREGRGRRRL